MTDPADIRERLVDILHLDLVGPEPGGLHERETLLTKAPSSWYLSGFLVPYEAPESVRHDEEAADGIDAGGDGDAMDDASAPEAASGRKAFFPSSMGMSVLVGPETRDLEITASWGDYHPDKPPPGADVEPSEDARVVRWTREPRRVTKTVVIARTRGRAARQRLADTEVFLVTSVRPVPKGTRGVPKGARAVSVFLVNHQRFETYHASFYRDVEASSVTPFSPRALDRGIAAVAVALARLGHRELTPAEGAASVVTARSKLDGIGEILAARGEGHARLRPEEREELRHNLDGRVASLLDAWKGIATENHDVGARAADRQPRSRRPADGRLRMAVPRVVRGPAQGRLGRRPHRAVAAPGTPQAVIRCECGKRKPMRRAMPWDEDGTPLGLCRGRRPWPGGGAGELCGGEGGKRLPNKLLIRSASNAYFPKIASAISIPDPGEKLRKAVDRVWEDLEVAESAADVARERKKKKMAAALEGFDDARVYAEVERRRSGGAETAQGLKAAELSTLLGTEDAMGDDTPEGDFFARAWPLPAERTRATRALSRVVLVHRLREVVAQVGFTRFDAPSRDVDYEVHVDVGMAHLARDLTWLPAVENRGEGVFIAFDPEAIARWAKKDEVRDREKALQAGFAAWQSDHPGSRERFPGVVYLMLHSLSHLLITAVSLECGYAASAIRERIYVGAEGCGILLYTGTPDAEGTLGGLCSVGKQIDHHLESALRLGTLCSNDPVCAQHRPDNPHEERFLHGAACHGCLLIAEPSCEWRNELLDRTLVVGTVEDLGAELFGAGHLRQLLRGRPPAQHRSRRPARQPRPGSRPPLAVRDAGERRLPPPAAGLTRGEAPPRYPSRAPANEPALAFRPNTPARSSPEPE